MKCTGICSWKRCICSCERASTVSRDVDCFFTKRHGTNTTVIFKSVNTKIDDPLFNKTACLFHGAFRQEIELK